VKPVHKVWEEGENPEAFSAGGTETGALATRTEDYLNSTLP